MSRDLRVALVTVSYGSGDDLEHFLATLRAHSGTTVDVVVVDNKPGADGVEAVAERHSALYLPLAENPGYGAGMNAGVRLLKATQQQSGEHPFDAWFVCNPDVQFEEDVIAPLARVLTSDASIGSVGPRLLNDDGSVYPSARNIPAVSTGVGHALFKTVWPRNPWSRAYKNASDYAEQRDAGWLSGAAVMVSASTWEAVDGFDEAYFLNFEDIDLGYRLGLAGYRNVYVPSVSVTHRGGHSLEKHAEVSEQAMHVSAVRFMRKRYKGFWNSPVRWAVVVGLKIRGALIVRRVRRSRAPIKTS